MSENKKNRRLTWRLAIGAVIAAVYTVLCLVLQPISYGPVQFRISEALCALPLLLPEAVPGLFIGCVLANLLGGGHILDIVFGSLATLIAAYGTYKLRSIPLLGLLPPVIANGIIVSIVLHFTVNAPLWLTILSISLSEAVVVYALGYPLYLLLRKQKIFQ